MLYLKSYIDDYFTGTYIYDSDENQYFYSRDGKTAIRIKLNQVPNEVKEYFFDILNSKYEKQLKLNL